MTKYPKILLLASAVLLLLFSSRTESGTGCFMNSDTIEDAKSLFPLTVRERALLRILRLLPKPIALIVVGRLSL